MSFLGEQCGAVISMSDAADKLLFVKKYFPV